MKTPQRETSNGGLTIIEVLVIVAILFILAGLVLPPQAGHRTKARRIACVNNLKQIGLAFRMWANDNEEKFPWEVSVTKIRRGTMEFAESLPAWRHFTIISNELSSPKVLKCSSDSRQRATSWDEFNGNSHLSYFAGLDADETRPQTILSGDRNLKSTVKLTSGILRLTGATPVEWTTEIHKLQGNACMGDGSVQQLTVAGLNKQIEAALSTDTNRPVIRLAIPE